MVFSYLGSLWKKTCRVLFQQSTYLAYFIEENKVAQVLNMTTIGLLSLSLSTVV